MYKVFPITGGIPAAIAALLPGSVVHEITGKGSEQLPLKRRFHFGHPSGILEVEVEARQDGETIRVVQCTLGRTARKILERKVHIPKKAYESP